MVIVTSQLMQAPVVLSGRYEWQREDRSCEGQIAAAEKELGAFVSAVLNLYGRGAAAYAAERWVELVEDSNQVLVEGFPDWRSITVAAAGLLAKDFWLLSQ